MRGSSRGVVRNYGGHGIGRQMHEDPHVPNIGRPDRGVVLRSGLTLAIEPMLTLGSEDTTHLGDGGPSSRPMDPGRTFRAHRPSVRTGARVDAAARSRVRIMFGARLGRALSACVVSIWQRGFSGTRDLSFKTGMVTIMKVAASVTSV